jgi:hypothetical protein
MRYLSGPILVLVLWVIMISGRETVSGLREQMIGEWRSISILVKMNSANNTASDRLLAANEDNWEKVTGIRPVRTFFKPDGTYYAEYYNLKDSIVYQPSGEWSVSEDSLFVHQLKPKLAMLRYAVTIKNDVGEFRSRLDFDGDGQSDDEFFGVSRNVSVGE